MTGSLDRFRKAQERDYERALAEIREGHKRSHWIWYIFPQIHGLGFSSTSEYYAIKNLQEAKDYMNDPVLGAHLIEISEELLSLDSSDPSEVMGHTDDLKLLSCMTLFEKADPSQKIFAEVIDKFYGGRRDQKTLEILDKEEEPEEISDRQMYDAGIERSRYRGRISANSYSFNGSSDSDENRKTLSSVFGLDNRFRKKYEEAVGGSGREGDGDDGNTAKILALHSFSLCDLLHFYKISEETPLTVNLPYGTATFNGSLTMM